MNQKKIIVCDDSWGIQLLFKEYLKDLGFEYLMAKNGKEAIELLKNNKDIVLIFIDIEMPVMNGIDTINMIRKTLAPPHKNIPSIVITAHDHNHFLTKLKHHGFDDYLSKDCTSESIQEVIEKYI